MRGDQPGGERPHQGRQHPAGGEGAEQPRAQLRGVRLPGDDVEQHDDHAGAQALHRAAEDQHRHVLGEAGDEQPRGEHQHAREDAGPGRAPVPTSPPTTMPTIDVTRNALKGQAYQATPSSSSTAVGIAVPTAIASKAIRVTRVSSPIVVSRWPASQIDARDSSTQRPNPAGAPDLPGSGTRPGAAPRRERRPGVGARSYLRAVISSVAVGTTVLRSPMTPKSASSKIGASGSLLMATIVFDVCMPARCWMAPEMPTAT